MSECSFDYGRFAAWPEYDRLARALDDFAHRLDREDDDLSVAGLGELASDLATHLRYCDCCP